MLRLEDPCGITAAIETLQERAASVKECSAFAVALSNILSMQMDPKEFQPNYTSLLERIQKVVSALAETNEELAVASKTVQTCHGLIAERHMGLVESKVMVLCLDF